MGATRDAGTPVNAVGHVAGRPEPPWGPPPHLELKVRVFQELLVHDFCKLVDSSQEDPGRGEKVTRPVVSGL